MAESIKSGSDCATPTDRKDNHKELLKAEKQKCKILKNALKEEKAKQEQSEKDLQATIEKSHELQIKLQEKVSPNLSILRAGRKVP
jgi:hypothetical protein